MAAAMGAALLLPAPQALALFAALGLGIALPFLAVAEVPALRRSDAAMPEEYSLAAGENASYHIVYEVPDSRSTFSVCYQERFRDNTVGDSYFVFFSMDKEGRAIATSET